MNRAAQQGPQAPGASKAAAGDAVRGPFLLGFNAQIAQLLILREALILSNGSETALGLCLGAWALLNGAGAATGVLARRAGLHIGRLFAPLLVFLPAVLGASLHVARISRSFTGVSGAEHLPAATFFILALLAVGPATFLDGLLFVCGLARFFGRRGGGDGADGASGRGAAAMYGLASIGSLAGGVVFAFVLIHFLDPFSIVGMLLLLNAVCVLVTAARNARGRPALPVTLALAFACMAGAALIGGGPSLNRLSEEARWGVLQPAMELVAARESPYQNLALLSYHDELTMFGNGGVILNLMPPEASAYHDYDRAVFPSFAMLQHLAPRDVMLIGGGLKGYAADILAHGPEHVEWVEYDRVLVEMAAELLPEAERAALNDFRVERSVTDGRYAVRTAAPSSQDLIIVGVPDPSNAAANRYYTREFFGYCRRALREDGVLVFTITCQPNFIGREMMERNASILAALGDVFERWVITPGEVAFVAAGGPGAAVAASADELRGRYTARGIETPRFNAVHFDNVLEDDDVEWINAFFAESLARERIVMNTDDRPAAYFKHHVLWRHEMRSGVGEGSAPEANLLETWLSGTGRAPPPLLFAPAVLAGLGLAFLCGALLAPRGRRWGASSARLLFFTTAAAAGFNGIVFEMALLLSYQSAAGHLYSRMGIIIAAFMAGLAAGSLAPCGRRSAATPFVLSMFCTFAGAAAALTMDRWAEAVGFEGAVLLAYAAVTAVLGASGGLAFRGVAMALESNGRSPGGIIYALDILGTCLGGMMAGAVFAPFIGITGALAVAAGLNLMLPALAVAALSVRAGAAVRC